MAKEIEIHPGHWNLTNSGANGYINEVKEARRVAKRVYEILKSSKVRATYYEDNSSKNQRENINYLVSQHNKDCDGLIVSIHFNASSGSSSKGIGTEVLYYSEKDLAIKVAKAISDVSGLLNRGAKKRTDLGVLAKTYEPAILIEVCFVNSSVDVALYRRDFEKICQAIAQVLANYLGKSTKPSTQIIVEKKEEKPVDLLNKTGRAETKELIKRGVAENLFTSKHQDVDKYTDAELISYSFAYINRKLKNVDKL
ncbi:N-acetylmuramoyl-L-alanine amidase [Ureibacillus sinduriensis]|uniref:N-acetylmuramoyl-L-alanine amidase n=1 Tax=Ureibacillus sinduriensis TaxID=561440 RepID=UPI0006911830|nr:N-acetylmuramoyl-L-alanine amidase [Ureibacillus sinduriensis]